MVSVLMCSLITKGLTNLSPFYISTRLGFENKIKKDCNYYENKTYIFIIICIRHLKIEACEKFLKRNSLFI